MFNFNHEYLLNGLLHAPSPFDSVSVNFPFNVLEAIFIARLKPELCLQNEFVRSLCLF